MYILAKKKSGLSYRLSCRPAVSVSPGVLSLNQQHKTPAAHVEPFAFQLDFEDFDLEQSHTCSYDSLAILGDVEGAEEIGRKKPPSPSPTAHNSAVAV